MSDCNIPYVGDNVFAKIIRGELPCRKVYEDEHVFAFHDINPEAPVHILVVPKGQYVSYHDFVSSAAESTVVHFFRTVGVIADKYSLGRSGYKLVTNHGKSAGQIVFHFHVHILGYNAPSSP